MRALRVGPGDIDEVAAAIEAARRVAACPPAGAPTGVPDASVPSAGRAEPPGLPTGAVGFSYSAGPVLLALDREESARPGDFAVLFGGYDDLVDVVRFLTTGRHRDLGSDYGGGGPPPGRRVILRANPPATPGTSDPAIPEEIRRP